MEQEITFGARLLNGFLSVAVIALIVVLSAVAVCLILGAVGVL